MTHTVDWINAAGEAAGRDSIDMSPFEFRHGGGGHESSSVAMQLESVAISAIYLRIALIQVSLIP